MPNAAYIGCPVSHTHSGLGLIGGLIAGAVVGAALAVAVVATGGAALVAVALVGASVAAGGGIGEVLGSMSLAGVDIVGAILTGAKNVWVNGKLAAAAHIGTASCSKDGPAPQLLAQGSANVFVNGMPFGRVGDLHTCSAKIEKGSTNVHVGGGTVTTDKIDPEIPAWMNWTLGAIGLASAIVLAGPLVAALGTAGGIGGGMGGEWLGGKLFGEGSDGQKLMMLGGGLLGGFAGAKGAGALGEAFVPKTGGVAGGMATDDNAVGAAVAKPVKPPPDGYKTYTTHGITDNPMNSPAGKRLVIEYQKQGYSDADAVKKASYLMETGSTPPLANPVEPGDAFYKVVPKGGMPGPKSEFWATKDQIDALQGMDADQIGSHLGLPLESQQAGSYSVVKIQAVRPTTSFTSRIAATSQNGWDQDGGGIQTLLIDRGDGGFTSPVETGITLP